MIDHSQYGAAAGHPALGAADYKLSCHLPTGRSVYTFYMCPGGSVVASASEPGSVVTNGMSAFARDGENANSALLVGVGPGTSAGTTRWPGFGFNSAGSGRPFCWAARTTRAPPTGRRFLKKPRLPGARGYRAQLPARGALCQPFRLPARLCGGVHAQRVGHL